MSARGALLEGVLPRLVPGIPRHLLPALAKALDKHLQMMEAAATILPNIAQSPQQLDAAMTQLVELFLPSAAVHASRQLFSNSVPPTPIDTEGALLQALEQQHKPSKVRFTEPTKSYGSYLTRQLPKPKPRAVGEEACDDKLETASLASGVSAASDYSLLSLPAARSTRSRYGPRSNSNKDTTKKKTSAVSRRHTVGVAAVDPMFLADTSNPFTPTRDLPRE